MNGFDSLHDASSSLFIRERELDLAVQPSGSQKSGIQDVDSISCGNDLEEVEKL